MLRTACYGPEVDCEVGAPVKTVALIISAAACVRAGIPIAFDGISLPYADYPRPPQSGDIVFSR